jgi:hypothetical protein
MGDMCLSDIPEHLKEYITNWSYESEQQELIAEYDTILKNFYDQYDRRKEKE